LVIGEFVELVLELQTINFYQSFFWEFMFCFSILDDKTIIVGRLRERGEGTQLEPKRVLPIVA
jgi:hypothetical protein